VNNYLIVKYFKKISFLLAVCVLTACNTVSYGFSEMLGLSFLHDRRESKAILLDEHIEDSLLFELRKLEHVKDRSHVNITAYNGKVLVTGEAETDVIQERIIAQVRIIDGVKMVHNELRVAPMSSMAARSTDSMITLKVKNALADEIKNQPGFDVTRVKVVTEDGVVYLMGLVHKPEGDAAAKVAQTVKGVRKILTVFEYIQYSSKK